MILTKEVSTRPPFSAMICFVINVHKENKHRIQRLVEDLRLWYHSADVFLIYDGVPSMGIPSTVEFEMAHRKSEKYGGEWTHRYLSIYLSNSIMPYVIKIDPDTIILGRIINLPDEDCIFCRVLSQTDHSNLRFVHGGAIGFTRNMASTIVNGGYMMLDRWKNNLRCGNYNDTMLSIVADENQLKIMNRIDFACKSDIHSWSVFYHK